MHNTNQPSQIVFDVGHVLIEWDPRNLYRKIFADPEQMEWFLAHVFTVDLNRECDRGLLFKDAVAQATARYPDWHEAIKAYDERWEEMVPSAIVGTVAILEEARRKNIPTHAITNFSHEKFELTRKRFDFLNHFITLVVSGEEHLLKPDAAIFELFLQRAGIQASECVFIDNTWANVEAARQMGMSTIHFTNPETLRMELQKLGFDL